MIKIKNNVEKLIFTGTSPEKFEIRINVAFVMKIYLLQEFYDKTLLRG